MIYPIISIYISTIYRNIQLGAVGVLYFVVFDVKSGLFWGDSRHRVLYLEMLSFYTF